MSLNSECKHACVQDSRQTVMTSQEHGGKKVDSLTHQLIRCSHRDIDAINDD